MLPPWTKTTHSRKYVNLLFKTTGPRIPSIDHTTMLEVGDYGKLDRLTGKFLSEGNISVLEELKDKDLSIVQDAQKNYEFFRQGAVSEVTPIVAEACVNLAGGPDFTLRTAFQYGTERSAVLLMVRPQVTRFKHPGALAKLSALRGKQVITEVVLCTAYYLCMSRQAGRSIDIKLGGTPLPVAPMVSAGGSVQFAWSTEDSGLTESQGSDQNGSYRFAPLFTLQRPSEKTFRSGMPEDIVWENVSLPWEKLDEDGNELLEVKESVSDW